MRVLASIPNCGSPWIFPGRDPSKPISDIFLFWKKTRSELDLGNIHIHDLRHSFASVLVNCGCTLYEVQRLLGHTSPQTTMRYAHLARESLIVASEKAAAAFK